MKKHIAILGMVICAIYSIDAMDDNGSKPKKRHVVYSHGFGEFGNQSGDFDFLGDSNSAPVYPDAPGNLGKGVFYTKPAVHTLANHLHNTVNAGHDSIVLVGRSCGGGTAVNCLAQLTHYDPAYFQGTRVTSKEEADRIVTAINSGAFVQTAPFLGLRKANAVAIPSTILAGATFTAATVAALHYAPSVFEGKASDDVAKIGILGVGAITYSVFGNFLKNIYASTITRTIVPYLTNYNFDASHPEPINEVEKLRGKITCPTLLHFNKEDRVLENPDNDTIKVYDALKGDNTHIIITDDSWHNGHSLQFTKELQDFKKKHLEGKDIGEQTTQPTTDQLRKQIYPRDLKSIVSRHKMATLATVVAVPLTARAIAERTVTE